MRHARRIVPDAVPEVLGEDRAGRMFAMAYLDPDAFPTWKAQLLAGRVDLRVAGAVGERLGRIHGASAGSGELAAAFDTGALFHAIRLEPYLLATARAHPGLAAALEDLARVTAAERHTLVHGDVSPKNLLLGPAGPVFLDAECAWYGDPAFDVAFCLNHLLLKCLPAPRARGALLEAFDALWDAYRRHVSWEPAARLEARTARLLPGLFLARVDGKSPVEYLAGETDRARVRRVARGLLERAPRRLGAVRDAWRGELER